MDMPFFQAFPAMPAVFEMHQAYFHFHLAVEYLTLQPQLI